MAQPRRGPPPPPPSPVREAGRAQASDSQKDSTGKQETSQSKIKRVPAGTHDAPGSASSLPVWAAGKAWEKVVRAPAGRLVASTSGVVPVEAWSALIVLLYLLLLVLGYRAVRRWLRQLSGHHPRGRSKSVVFLGPSGGGKTSLFLLLRNGKVTPTVPSMQENVDTLCVDEDENDEGTRDDEEEEEDASKREGVPRGDKNVTKKTKQSLTCQVVDFPGHAKLQELATPYIDRASGIVFLVDAADKKSFKVAAEQLYELFTKPILHVHQVPLLLVVNKVDLPDARSESTVTEDLEREIERSRASRAALLEGEDDATNFIGVEGEVFKFLEHSPFPMEICSASVKNNDIAAIRDFLVQQCRENTAG